jgi:hypothetical protein
MHFQSEKLKESDNYEEVVANWGIILKRILKKCDVREGRNGMQMVHYRKQYKILVKTFGLGEGQAI